METGLYDSVRRTKGMRVGLARGAVQLNRGRSAYSLDRLVHVPQTLQHDAPTLDRYEPPTSEICQ